MTNPNAAPVCCSQTVLARIETVIETSVNLCVFVGDSHGLVGVTLGIERHVGSPDIPIVVVRSTGILVT